MGRAGFRPSRPLGPLGAARRASHTLGPVLIAHLGSGDSTDDDAAQVEAGLLLGTGGVAPRATLRLQALIPF